MQPVGNGQESAPYQPDPYKQIQATARCTPLVVGNMLALSAQVLSAIGAVVMMVMTSILGHLVPGILPSGEGLDGWAKHESVNTAFPGKEAAYQRP